MCTSRVCTHCVRSRYNPRMRCSPSLHRQSSRMMRRMHSTRSMHPCCTHPLCVHPHRTARVGRGRAMSHCGACRWCAPHRHVVKLYVVCCHVHLRRHGAERNEQRIALRGSLSHADGKPEKGHQPPCSSPRLRGVLTIRLQCTQALRGMHCRLRGAIARGSCYRLRGALTIRLQCSVHTATLALRG